jgi:hypothetical protein
MTANDVSFYCDNFPGQNRGRAADLIDYPQFVSITIGTGIVFCAHASSLYMPSVPQIKPLDAMRTSLGPISGTGTSSKSSPGSGGVYQRPHRATRH